MAAKTYLISQAQLFQVGREDSVLRRVGQFPFDEFVGGSEWRQVTGKARKLPYELVEAIVDQTILRLLIERDFARALLTMCTNRPTLLKWHAFLTRSTLEWRVTGDRQRRMVQLRRGVLRMSRMCLLLSTLGEQLVQLRRIETETNPDAMAIPVLNIETNRMGSVAPYSLVKVKNYVTETEHYREYKIRTQWDVEWLPFLALQGLTDPKVGLTGERNCDMALLTGSWYKGLLSVEKIVYPALLIRLTPPAMEEVEEDEEVRWLEHGMEWERFAQLVRLCFHGTSVYMAVSVQPKLFYAFADLNALATLDLRSFSVQAPAEA